MEVTFVHRGEFALSLEHFEKALSLYDPERDREAAFFYSQNSEVAMRSHAAWVHWFLGQPDQALKQMQETLTLARELGEPHGLAHAFYFAAVVRQLRREHRLAQECAEAVIAISSEHGLALYQSFATIVRGWALIEQGLLHEEGIGQMRQGLVAHSATGARLARPHFLALLAEALGRVRQAEEGLRVLEEALEVAHHHGEGCYLAELYRIQGELLLTQATPRGVWRAVPSGIAGVEGEPPAVARAQDCFSQAIKISRQQKAKTWELRAVTSLARVYQNQGKREEARGLLTQIYDRFTEGFDTVDLRETKALIVELS